MEFGKLIVLLVLIPGVTADRLVIDDPAGDQEPPFGAHLDIHQVVVEDEVGYVTVVMRLGDLEPNMRSGYELIFRGDTFEHDLGCFHGTNEVGGTPPGLYCFYHRHVPGTIDIIDQSKYLSSTLNESLPGLEWRFPASALGEPVGSDLRDISGEARHVFSVEANGENHLETTFHSQFVAATAEAYTVPEPPPPPGPDERKYGPEVTPPGEVATTETTPGPTVLAVLALIAFTTMMRSRRRG